MIILKKETVSYFCVAQSLLFLHNCKLCFWCVGFKRLQSSTRRTNSIFYVNVWSQWTLILCTVWHSTFVLQYYSQSGVSFFWPEGRLHIERILEMHYLLVFDLLETYRDLSDKPVSLMVSSGLETGLCVLLNFSATQTVPFLILNNFLITLNAFKMYHSRKPIVFNNENSVVDLIRTCTQFFDFLTFIRNATFTKLNAVTELATSF